MIVSMIPGFSSGINAKQTKAILDYSTTTTDAEKVQILRDLWKVYEAPANAIVASSGAYLTTLSGKYIIGQGA